MRTDPAFSVRRGLPLGVAALVLLCAGLFGWGSFATLSGAVVVTGQVEAEGGDRTVEHLDGGTVAAIPVRDGDRVEAGAVLVRLDGALLASEAKILEAELHELVGRRNRLEAEIGDADEIRWDAELLAAPAARKALEGHGRLFEARRVSRAGLVRQLRERIHRIRRQIAGMEAQLRALKRRTDIARRDLKIRKGLSEKKLTPLPRVLEGESRVAALDGIMGETAADIEAAHAQIAELETQILQIDRRRIEESEAGMREAQSREHAVREQLEALRIRLGRLHVRAPSAGVVHDLSVSAVGEVLHAGEPVAKIVPEDEKFVVKARLEPIHVDQVWPGQEAILRFSAFSMQTTPEYTGRVARVSADALTDEQSNLSWYEVEVAIGRPVEPDAGWMKLFSGPRPAPEPLALAPGMPVEAYLRTEARSPLNYLVKPLTDYFKRALREE